ncbi:FAD binding domain-containing protein [Actinospongicola halichondriae]|uniref:FAD binding domain-containing protein n=1 Tax=Actinospongicola halichondriae TaxID=3236844 RepID=UPI003D43F021
MIPAGFDYTVAESSDAALAALAEHGDEAKLLAGGHSLIPLLKFRFAAPSVLVDIGRIDDLSYIREDDGHLAIGALSTHRDVESSDLLKQGAPMLAHVASQIGDPSVRHRGTIGGSLAHGDPASDLPAALLALGGSVVAKGPNGTREIAATELFTSFLETALQPDELLTEIRVPKVAAGAGWSYQKFNRRAQDWAIVAAAVQMGDEPRVALVNMATTPIRSSAVEAALGSGAGATDAAAVAAEGMSPPEDLNGDAEYRGHLASVLVERAILEASTP